MWQQVSADVKGMVGFTDLIASPSASPTAGDMKSENLSGKDEEMAMTLAQLFCRCEPR